MRVLFAEDEKDLNRIVTRKLTDEGYSVDSCLDGGEAIDYIDSADYDVIILDIMMPVYDGFHVLAHIRKSGNTTPVIFLTARDAVEDRIKGLDSGANDYLVKPFSFDELLARIRAALRNSHPGSSADGTLICGDLELDPATHRVTRGNDDLQLSSREFALLEYMMRNNGIVLTRQNIEDHIWNFDYEGGTNVVDVYVSYLRRKIDDGHDEKLIRTIRGVGYMIKSEAE